MVGRYTARPTRPDRGIPFIAFLGILLWSLLFCGLLESTATLIRDTQMKIPDLYKWNTLPARDMYSAIDFNTLQVSQVYENRIQNNMKRRWWRECAFDWTRSQWICIFFKELKKRKKNINKNIKKRKKHDYCPTEFIKIDKEGYMLL